MARTPVNVSVQNMYDVATVVPTVIDSTLVTNGVYVPNALNNKTGSTRVRVYNSSIAANQIYFMKASLVDLTASPYGGFATGVNTVEYTIPSNTICEIILNQYEGYIKKLDGSILINFNTGFTGSIDVVAEQLHLYESGVAPVAVFI